MNNQFWNKWNNEFRGYGEPTNNYNQNANHQVSNNINSYNSWSNNWNEPKQQDNTSWNWNYFNEELKQEKKRPNPAKSFNPQEFLNTEFMNDFRADGNKTHRWDLDKPNTNWEKTSYGRKDEKFHTLANGVPYNDKNVKLNGNNYQYYDSETNQYHDIYALGMNQLKEYGHHANKNVNVWDNDIYGSLIDVHHADGSVTSGIIMDASSAGNKKANLDQWTEYVDPNNETVTWNFKRIGWGSTKNPKR